MREIKFRAWNPLQSEMIYFEPFDAVWRGEGGVSMEALAVLPDPDDVPGASAIFMQYTGLKDRNGVEIYEGDIVLAYHPDDEDREMDKVLAVVVFDAPSFHAKYVDDGLNKFVGGGSGFILRPDNKVIGNVYENPDLLNK